MSVLTVDALPLDQAGGGEREGRADERDEDAGAEHLEGSLVEC